MKNNLLSHFLIVMAIFLAVTTSCKKDDNTPQTVTDADGNVYHTVTIGTQTWMTENLKTTRYRNGDLIGTTTPATLNISGQTTPKYQWACAGNETNVATYGRFYTWYAVTDSRNLCPEGWHVPTNAEWATLFNYLGGENVAGGKLKEAGLTHWQSPNTGATNQTGFSALPSGYRNMDGGFYYLGYSSFCWSSSESSANKPSCLCIDFNNSKATFGEDAKYNGFPVRCIKD